MDSIGERLAYVIDNIGISRYRIATDLNIGKSTITNYLNNLTKPDSSKLDAICNYLNINKTWLLTGKGEIYRVMENRHSKECEKVEDSYTIKELVAAIKRRDEQVDALIKVNEKHADNFAELLKQMKKTDAPKDGGAVNADASGFSTE